MQYIDIFEGVHCAPLKVQPFACVQMDKIQCCQTTVSATAHKTICPTLGLMYTGSSGLLKQFMGLIEASPHVWSPSDAIG